MHEELRKKMQNILQEHGTTGFWNSWMGQAIRKSESPTLREVASEEILKYRRGREDGSNRIKWMERRQSGES